MKVENKIKKNIDIDLISKVVAECTVETIPELLEAVYDINEDNLDRQTYRMMLAEILHKVASMLPNAL